MSRAHGAGGNAEKTILQAIETYLTSNVYTYREWVAEGEPCDCVVQHFPYRSIYGSERAKTEFVLIEPDGGRVRIEVKWQVMSGSVDEKFPYLMKNAEIWPEETIIIVTGGGGAKKEAVDWLESEAVAVSGRTGKNIHVMRSTDEFVTWCHRKYRSRSK
jgi:hypothetical protein